MELYVDTGDLNAIRDIAEFYPIDGFTTNPKLLAQAGSEGNHLMSEYRKFIGETGLDVFIQVTEKSASGMYHQAQKLQEFFGPHLVVKIPAVRDGYKAVRLCCESGIRTCVTAVHSVMQAVIAAKAGAEYVAPYISHIDNIGADSVQCVGDMLDIFSAGGYTCSILAASFKSVSTVKDLAVTGCQAITLKPELFDDLIIHPSTAESLIAFDEIWHCIYGDKHVDELL